MHKEIKYVIKNVDTGEYFIDWELATDVNGRYIRRKPIHSSYYNSVFVKVPRFSKTMYPKIYNSYGGARKIISEFVGSSFAKEDKLNNTEKILYGDKELSKYQVVKCTVKIVELKDGKEKQ